MTKQNVILHIDMNSYFASVEQQANPLLRGRPVGVCAYLSKRGCIIASSREAKEKGIGTGCRVDEALRLYNKIVLVQNDPPKYRTVTKKIFKILGTYTEQLEPYSIDEAFLDLTGWTEWYRDLPQPPPSQGGELKHPPLTKGRKEEGSHLKIACKIGKEINQRIKDEVGEWLGSSVGVAETRFWAKLLSDTGPKDSVSYIEPGQYEHYLAGVKLTDIWGINYRLEKRFHRLGIRTPLDLINASGSKIIQHFGKYGYFLWLNLQNVEPRHAFEHILSHETGLSGAESRTESHKNKRSQGWLSGAGIGTVKTEEELLPKSIGHSYVMPKKTTDKKYLAAILMKLCEKTGRRLREKNLDARGMNIYWGYSRGGGDGMSFKLPKAVFDSWDIFKAAWSKLDNLILPDDVSMMAVAVRDLVPPSNQLNLFEDCHSESLLEGSPAYAGSHMRGRFFAPLRMTTRRKRSLVKSLDQVNNRYGEFTIINGAMWGTAKNAPDRIGFRKSVSWRE
jgi:nucleotidyltransferase/DNA polymerase involved in DNA repair